jgi:aminopeptidase
MTDERLQRYAELAVRVGANVGEGQYVLVDAQIDQAPLTRAIANAAYAAGARFVDVRYADLYVRRAMIEHAPDEMLRFSPPWMVQRLQDAGAEEAAQIMISGRPRPEVFEGLDGERLGRAQPVAFNEAHMQNINSRAINWTIVAWPDEEWSKALYGEPDLERLWSEVATAVRLDEDDPIAAWQSHVDRLEARAAALNDARFDAIRMKGPATDLTIGLLPGSRWRTGATDTASGRRHVANLPTEEVFTSPDPERADGYLRSTKPLALQGTVVHDLELRFENGRIVHASDDVVRAELATDENANRLGELALVDGTSRVGKLGTVFLNTLFDENAASHIAYGSGFPRCAEGDDVQRVNESSVHTDLMVGSAEVDFFGLDADGAETPIIIANEWRLGA